jgi:hypothetical protein
MRASLIALSMISMPGRSTLIHIARAVLAVVGAAACAVFILAVAARSREGSVTRSVENGGDWYARSPGWFVTRGLHPTEHAPDGSAFAWAGGRVRLTIPRLDRHGRYQLTLRARSGRSSAEPPAIVRVVVDGLDTATLTIGSDWQECDVTLPVAQGDGVVVLMDAQQTFTPGPQDPRALAFMIEQLTLTPLDAASVPIPHVVLLHAGLLAGAVALAAALCLLPVWIAFATGTAAGTVAAWLVLFDAAFLGRYSSVLAALSMAIAISGGLACLLTGLAHPASRRAWRAAALVAIVVTALRLAVFLHPDAPTSDGMFHVHRAQAVRSGDYFFTSVTPPPFYEFPYPVGLYVVAQPLWDRVPNRVALLRGIALVADALVALGLFAVVAARRGAHETRGPRSAVTGVLAAALALAVPVITQSVSTANLTNVFAQSCFSLALVWIGWHLPSTRPWLAVAGSVVLLSASYLSHFSTAVIGAPAATLMAVAAALARDPREARAWRWIALSVGLALALSYLVYYVHFHDIYARTLSRVGTERAETSLVATLAEHSESKPVTMLRFLVVNYGWGALALAAAGTAAALRRDWRDGWTLILLAVGLTVLGFAALGALTPIELRANLAAHPVVAALAALGLAWLWNTKRVMLRVAAVAALSWTAWLGIAALRDVLG